MHGCKATIAMRDFQPMDEMEQLSALIGGVYDAALEPALWPEALAGLANFVGGPAAGLFSKDASSKTGLVAYGHGIDSHYQKIYFEHYIKLDPATTGHFFSEVDEPMATVDLVPYDEFLQSRFYLEWAKPQGLVDFIASALDKSVTGVAMFGVFRHERDGVATDETRRRMRLVVPHVRRAVLIGRLIDVKTTEAKNFSGALDSLSAGMVLVDATGRIVHANATGLAMLAHGSPLQGVNGILGTTDPQVDRQFGEIFAAAGTGDLAIGVKGIAVPMNGRNGVRHVAHVLPLTAGARSRTGASYRAVAAVFVREATIDMASPPELVAKAFKLTPTELRIMLAIIEVGGVPEVAVALGIAESTVKTHLGRLYEKTGARRQADLVKIFAGYASPAG